jgi:hypothetical protein
MKTTLSEKDWIQLSATLDGRLSGSELVSIEKRLETEPEFKQAYRELKYTRFLLRSLPVKRAPRNFTLSQQYARKPAAKWPLQSFLGLASAGAALVVVALFVSVNLLPMRASKMAAPMAAPMAAALPESSAADAAANSADNSFRESKIITWNQWGQYSGATGMGGGGGGDGMDAAALTTRDGSGIGSGGGGEAPVELFATPTPVAPLTAAESPEIANNDPSTLILGIPEEGTGGQVITTNAPVPTLPTKVISPTTLWMIVLGGVSVICGILALLFRRR